MNAIHLLKDCPLCGHPLDTEGPAVDLDNNLFLVGGMAIEVKPQQAEILSVICDAYPGVATFERILTRVTGYDYCDISPPTLRTQVSLLRKQIAPFATIDDARRQKGYRLRVA